MSTTKPKCVSLPYKHAERLARLLDDVIAGRVNTAFLIKERAYLETVLDRDPARVLAKRLGYAP